MNFVKRFLVKKYKRKNKNFKKNRSFAIISIRFFYYIFASNKLILLFKEDNSKIDVKT